jgi:hypothetical protein
MTASGTVLDLADAAPTSGSTKSQISLTSGSLSKRLGEFALFRSLGPLDVGVDFEDRFEGGFTLYDEVEKSRVWFHFGSVQGRRPRWSFDVSLGGKKHLWTNSQIYKEDARRATAALWGPLFGGETRVAVQGRRIALSLTPGPAGEGFSEVRLDGLSALADWAAPVPGLTLRGRYDLDRRRGLIAPATLSGFRGGAVWSLGEGDGLVGAAEFEAGYQEPFGATWNGSAALAAAHGASVVRVSVGHEEGLPPLVIGLDRPAPEEGFAEQLALFENTDTPERRSALRLEGETTWGRLDLALGGWAARERGYRFESNPLWILSTRFAPVTVPSRSADVLGAFGELGWRIGGGFALAASGRVHTRERWEVPYLSPWTAEGALHWRRTVLTSLVLDVSVGGQAFGSRLNPRGELIGISGVTHALVVGRIDNGVISARLDNLADYRPASDLRFPDALSKAALAGRTLSVGLTLYLAD